MYKGLVIERKGNVVKRYIECNIERNVSVSVNGSRLIIFDGYDKPMLVYENELNTWLNVDYKDIDSMMFCLIEE